MSRRPARSGMTARRRVMNIRRYAMKQMMRCKACGYVMSEDRLGEKCPACGVSSKAFEPWTDPLSPRRRFLIDLDMHPIMLHFPQALSVLVPVLILADQLLPLPRGIEVTQAIRVLSILVFPAAAAAFAAGLVDGHSRFRKIGTPALIRKMVIGSVFLGTAFALSLTAFLHYTVEPVRWTLFVLALVGLGLQVILAQIGKRLMCVFLPGK